MESLLYGKPMPIPNYRLLFGIIYIFAFSCGCHCIHVASSTRQVVSRDLDVNPVKNNFNIIGCMPFSRKYLTNNYIEKHISIPQTSFHDFVDHEFGSRNCVGVRSINNAIGIIDLHRQLVGEGSHRRLISNVKIRIQPDKSWFDDHYCEALIIERLPDGIFADPFELQHLVQRQVYLDAGVFGDTNLELPSALSNSSVVEVHMTITQDNLKRSCEITTELPLHARYPPLDESGYSRVEIGTPDILMRCRPKSSEHAALTWTLSAMNGSANNVTWLIPSGKTGHTGFVSSVTFVSALFSALLLVFSSMYCSTNNDIKSS